MPVSVELRTFVQEALARGVPRSEISAALGRAGWSQAQVSEGLSSFADEAFPVPIPRPRPHTNAGEAFLYGLLFGAMIVGAYNVGALVFVFIDRAFPQA